MKKALFVIITIAILMAPSCTKKGIIPKNTLSDIYFDLYIADQQMSGKKYTDTLLVYEPIFQKYGFTAEDYLRTTTYYLQKPDKFAKIYKVTQSKLKKRKDQLDRLMAIEDGKNFRWTLLDSLSALGAPERNGNAYYRSLNLIFFVPDTIPVTSPAIDSAIINNVENVFFLYDSLTIFDGDISILLQPKEEVINVKKSSDIKTEVSKKSKTLKKLQTINE